MFVSTVCINTDDDFDLDILDIRNSSNNANIFELDESGYILICAEDKEDLIKKTIKILEEAKFTFVKTWSVTRGNTKEEGDYSHAWYSIRDKAIEALKRGEENIGFGGNQTIDIGITKNYLAPEKKNSTHRHRLI